MNTTTSISPVAGVRTAGLGLVLAGGLVAGALDLTFAFLFLRAAGRHARTHSAIHCQRGARPSVVPDGPRECRPRRFLPFFISVCAAGIYYLASLRFAFLTRRVLIAGATFGVLVFLTMHFVVVPLSAVKSGPVKLSSVIGELCSHIFLFGMPIAYAASRAALRRPR